MLKQVKMLKQFFPLESLNSESHLRYDFISSKVSKGHSSCSVMPLLFLLLYSASAVGVVSNHSQVFERPHCLMVLVKFGRLFMQHSANESRETFNADIREYMLGKERHYNRARLSELINDVPSLQTQVAL